LSDYFSLTSVCSQLAIPPLFYELVPDATISASYPAGDSSGTCG
jgi:hypothetical protein